MNADRHHLHSKVQKGEDACWAISEETAASSPEKHLPPYSTVRKKLRHKQGTRSPRHWQSLVQTIAFEISERNFIHSLKFCFLIWFINDMRQKLSSCAYKVASAPRNPDVIWDAGYKQVFKKRERIYQNNCFPARSTDQTKFSPAYVHINYLCYTSQHTSSGAHETKC